MTLILMVLNRFGVWQSSDHRLVNLRSAAVRDDSVKQLALVCKDGAALISYAGIGSLAMGREEVVLSDWLRETLRGDAQSLDQKLRLLQKNATRDLARPFRDAATHHLFMIGAFLMGRPWFVEIRNFSPLSRDDYGPVLDHFETVAQRVNDSGVSGQFGVVGAVSQEDARTLNAVAGRRPRELIQFRNLLAAINRRAAATPEGRDSISAQCATTYMPPTGIPVESTFHGGNELGLVTMFVPTLISGIDMTILTMDSCRPEGTPTDEQALKESTIPKNRLRR